MKTLYKKNKGDRVYWVDGLGLGEFVFTIDKKKYYNLFRDYPDKMSVRDWMIFNAENDFWEDFFKEPNEEYEIRHWDEIKKLLEGE